MRIQLGLFAAVTVAIFSGIVISQKAIPILMGTKPPDMNKFWMRWAVIHADYGVAVLELAAFHIAINLDWLFAAVRSVFRRFREASL